MELWVVNFGCFFHMCLMKEYQENPNASWKVDLFILKTGKLERFDVRYVPKIWCMDSWSTIGYALITSGDSHMVKLWNFGW
jgi:hypothetical protein